MTQLTVPNPIDLTGRTLYDVSGEGIGTIEGVYLDNVTRSPEWAAVRLGPDALALVPLADAAVSADEVQVDFGRDMVFAAPHRLTALDNEVTEETEDELNRYYTNGSGGSINDGVSANGRAAGTAREVAAEVKEQAAQAAEEAVEVAGLVKEQAADVAVDAKEQAAEVAVAAKEQAVSVAETAKEETLEVAQQASAEARELYETTRTELQGQAETQLEQFAETLHRLAGQALALARGNADQAGPVGELVGRAGREMQAVALDIETKGSPGLLADAQRAVRQRPRAAIIGTAAAVVAGAKLMGTPAGDRLKERLAPLKEQAIEAGRDVAEGLKPVAQQSVEQVRAVATEAAGQVKKEARNTAEDVKGTATQAGRTVKGTAKRSTTAVKGTARQAAATTKTTATTRKTARRTARSATPPAATTRERRPAGTVPGATARSSAARSSTAPRTTAKRPARPAMPIV